MSPFRRPLWLTRILVLMRIGIDFDNTIVCYDQLIYQEAVGRGFVTGQVEARKNAVRDALRQAGREEDWTRLQGFIYGPGMKAAAAFPGLREALARLHEQGYELFIISHKTRVPVLGPQHDLHTAAIRWLAAQQLLDRVRYGLSEDHVFFELTKQAKLSRIAECGCTHFVDDLPEFLCEPDFPAGVQRILFDPHDCCEDRKEYRRATSWQAIVSMIK